MNVLNIERGYGEKIRTSDICNDESQEIKKDGVVKISAYRIAEH